MSAVRVAVVDSGIIAGHPHVGGAVAAGTSLIEGVADTIDRLGHGTAVSAAIREKAPDAELVPVKVFDRALRTDAGTLGRAIEWAAGQGCALVNLSLGTTNAEHRELLDAAVRAAHEMGSLVVTALEADGVTYHPGSDGLAIAVVGDATVDRSTCRVEHTPGGAYVVRASIYPRPIPGVPVERNLHGLSFAVANVTGLLAAAMARSPGQSAAALLDQFRV